MLPASLFLADFAVKGLAVLALAAIAAYGLRRKSAATVHRVWVLGFVALLLLPAAGLVLPQRGVKVVPPSTGNSLSSADVAPKDVTARRESLAAAPAETTLVPTRPQGETSAAPREAAASPGLRAQTSAPVARAIDASEREHLLPITFPVVGAWALVAVVLLSRLAMHQAILARLLGRCTPVAGDEWDRATADAAQRLGLGRPVRLVMHAAATTPATAGTWKPTILLPGHADRWTLSQRRLVLLHELAHVKRFDVLSQLMAGVACAIHWFNPLAWYGMAQLRRLREIACDDLVLNGQHRPAEYAETLLQVARACRPLRLAGTIGMARGTNVERRILAILDTAQNRVPLTRRGATALAVVATTLILAVGSVRLENKSAAADDAKPAEATGGPTSREQDPDGRMLEVLISDEAGAPLPGAKVYASIWEVEGGKDYPNRNFTADERGLVRISIPQRLRILRLWPAHAGYVPEFLNFGEGTHDEGQRIPDQIHFKLARGTMLSGRIVDEAGQPIVGAKIEVSVDVREPAWGVGAPPMISTWLTDADFNSPASVTDADGRWSIDNAPAQTGEKDYEFRLKITHGDSYRKGGWGEFQREQGITTPMLRAGTATIVLKGGVVVEGIVVNNAGKPVTRGWVVWNDNPYFSDGTWESPLDREGQFRTLPLAAGEYPITVIAPGFAAVRRLVNVKPGMDVLDFKLMPGKRVSIQFVNAKGFPIPRVGVHLGDSSNPNTWNNSNAIHNQRGSGVPDYGIPRRANDEGLYAWDWAPEEPVMYSVGAKGFAPQTLSLVPKSSPHVVTLHDERVVRGMVTDAETGKPIAKFSAIPVIEYRQDFYHTRTTDAKIGHGGRYELPLTGSADPNDRYRVRFEADGYRSLVSEQSFGPVDGRATLNAALQPTPARTGRVVDADGQPVERAVILQASPTEVPSVSNNDPDSFDTRPIHTDAQGRFAFNATSESVLIRAFHDRGFVEVRREPSEQIGTLRLLPWARIEGRLEQDGRPVGNQTIIFSASRTGVLTEPRFQDSYQAQTDPEGRFVFERLPPIAGSVRAYLGPWQDSPLTSSESAPLDLQPSDSRLVVLGGDGATVTGKVVPTGRGDVPLDAHWSLNYLVSRDRGAARPADLPKLGFTPGEGKPIELAWLDDPHYHEWQATRSNYFVKLDPGGNLRVSGVPSGVYDLVVQLYEQPAGCLVQTVGRRIVPVELSDADVASGEKSVGQIEVPCRVGPRVGENMQAYKILDADGREQTILAMQGRFVLMHVWASWCGPCIEAFPDMKATVDKLSSKPIVFAGLNVDADSDQAHALAQANGWKWGQSYLGNDSDMARQLAISSVPAYYLIGPDGKLVTSSNEWPQIKKSLEATLSDHPNEVGSRK